MEDTSLFMQWAMDTLQHENPAPTAAAVVHDDFTNQATFPSLKALREASQAAEMVQELIAGDAVVQAPNSWNSGGGDGDTTANYNVPAGWNFGATSALPGRGDAVMMAPPPATRGRLPPDLVYGPPPTRRAAGFKGLGSMSASYAQDHIIAERKRREKINQRFIELSTVIPGLKKMDKATILLDATRHVKELQEKLKDLESGGSSGRSKKTLVLVNHAAAARDDDDEDDDDGSRLPASPAGTPTAGKQLPEIEVRFSESEKSVVVRVHCENRKGVVVNVLTEVEELHLGSIHANVMPFTACTRIITITAKVEEGFTVTAEEIVARLSSAVCCITASPSPT